jgi:hypothetical protein
MLLEGFLERFGEHRDPVIGAFAVADRDLASLAINIDQCLAAAHRMSVG